MEIIKEAFSRLYPGKDFDYDCSVRYSGKYGAYNAGIRKSSGRMELSLSKKWKDIDEEILIGLAQSLLLKLFNDKKKTMNVDLYNNFVRNLHLAAEKNETEPVLEESFNRVNENYFFGLVERPNLRWGNFSKRRLATYNYHTDTITVSSIFKGAENKVLDYLVYHELLHKKIKFSNKNGRNFHHTREFRQKEKKFEGVEEIEKEIEMIVRTARRPRLFI